MPAMDHHTLILPQAEDEWKTLFNIESQFDANDAWPPDPARNSEAAAFRALAFISTLPRLPLVFANHPSRSATGVGQYGLDEPREFRNNNDAAPQVYRGMEGAPGHQAGTLAPDGSVKRDATGLPAGSRGSYANDNAGTFGGFDQMTAVVGGLWDAMLGEGRRFWIVATSDSHNNFADPSKPGSDFWPGQYQKTYVRAHKSYEDILDGLRLGRIFAVAGDLVSELSIAAEADGDTAESGATLTVRPGTSVHLTISFRDTATPNANGDDPRVARLDVIAGDVVGPNADRNADRNETTRVVARYTSREWQATGDERTITTIFPSVRRSFYARARGTSTSELEPTMDPRGENPWSDLWMYSNPVFVMVQ